MTALGGKVILVFNGEIYNDADLRMELQKGGVEFIGTSDTEVILNLYLEYGFEEMLKRLNGMFSIVIVDLRFQRIFLARDRFGIKPLYYAFFKGRLAFASEIKSILQFRDFERDLDLKAFNARLAFSRPSDQVLLTGVEILGPGKAITIDSRGGTRFWQYYDINEYDRADGDILSVDEWLDALEEVLSRAAHRQMVSDVKVGCQLSGGIDSTLVSYFANKMDSDRLQDGVSIIDNAGDLGEERYINHVGNKLGLNLHKFKLEASYFLDNYERMIWHNDAPVYKPFFSCFFKLAESARREADITVLLSGEGSDEVAGGYSRFAAGVYQPFIKKMGIHSGNTVSFENYAEYAVMTDTTCTGLVSQGWQNLNDLIFEQMEIFNSFSGSNFTKHVKFEMTQRLPEALMRQDKMTMANSIENRVPLLDNEVVDFVMRLPEQMLLRFVAPSPLGLAENPFDWAAGKFLLKELCARKFGHDFAYRQKKIMVLDERAMLTSAKFIEYFYDSIYPGMRSRGLLDAELVRSWFDDAATIDIKTFSSMWRAISLETWCQLFLDARTNRVH